MPSSTADSSNTSFDTSSNVFSRSRRLYLGETCILFLRQLLEPLCVSMLL